MTLKIWQPKFGISQSTLNVFANCNRFNEYPKTKITEGVVDIETVGNYSLITADGIIPWHDDKHIDRRWAIFLVVRNDANSWVESLGVPANKNQPVGTMILLDIWHQHRLWNIPNKKCKNCQWAGIHIDLKRKPRSLKECEKLMAEEIQRHGDSNVTLHNPVSNMVLV